MNNINQARLALHDSTLLVSDYYNIQYLTGFRGSEGDAKVLLTPQKSYIITDSRYEEELSAPLYDSFEIQITRSFDETVVQLLNKEKITTLQFEDTLSYREYRLLKSHSTLHLSASRELIDKIRSVKTPSEIRAIKAANELSSEGYQYVLSFIKAGMTEKKVATLLDDWMKSHGSTGSSFETIVASGPRAAMPHGSATGKVIQDGEMVTLDFGYYVDGYTSDITRTFAVGNPSSKMKEIYEIVLYAQELVINTIHNGVGGPDLDQVGRDYITSKGFGKEFNHGMGHGIGLNIHEYPQSYGGMRKYQTHTNEIITVEPGIYVEGLGGVRIEDDLLITKDGYQNLTTAPKNLIIV